MHRLAPSVLEYIRKHRLLRPGDRLGIAVSGGADSVALFWLLMELREELGIVLAVVHFNHKLRGEESDTDEQFVRELAAKHYVSMVSSSGDVKARAAAEKISLEAAGREARYEFFKGLMLAGEFDKLATAHTLDDQAETVLLKLARGAGTRGLAGIYPKVSVQSAKVNDETTPVFVSSDAWASQAIIRPLLETRRSTLEKYLHELNQPWREDSSNCDSRHARNRVRHEVMPLLEGLLNPRIREALSDAAEIARAEEEYWEHKNQSLVQQAWEMQTQRGILDTKILRSQPLAVQRRLVRAGAESLGLTLKFRHVEQILALECEGAKAALSANWTATLHKSAICLVPGEREGPASYEYELRIPGRIAVPEARVLIEAKIATASECRPEALLARVMGGKSFTIRNWRSGDRFWPAHSKSPQKLKDLLQSRHITGDEKKCWPVIASGDEIVWVRDLGVRRDFQAKNGSGILIYATPLKD